MIEIKSLRNSKISEPYDYRCDRRNPILGNHVGQGMGRSEAIKAFDRFLSEKLADKSSPMNAVRVEMNRLHAIHRKCGKLRLFCWCAPLACHTELIAARLEAVF